MRDHSGVQKDRLQVKKSTFTGESHPTYFLRPSNGHSSPGIKCPESLYKRLADLTLPGAPCYFIHGTKWFNIPNAFHIALSFRADDIGNAIGCLSLPGDDRIQQGLRIYSEVLVTVGLKNPLRDCISMWRSASDIIMTAGRE
eukprot:2307197-Pyramimonas_sp.AAC.1